MPKHQQKRPSRYQRDKTIINGNTKHDRNLRYIDLIGSKLIKLVTAPGVIYGIIELVKWYSHRHWSACFFSFNWKKKLRYFWNVTAVLWVASRGVYVFFQLKKKRWTEFFLSTEKRVWMLIGMGLMDKRNLMRFMERGMLMILGRGYKTRDWEADFLA